MSPFEYLFFILGVSAAGASLVLLLIWFIHACLPDKTEVLQTPEPTINLSAQLQVDFDTEFKRLQALRSQRQGVLDNVTDLLATNLPTCKLHNIRWEGNIVRIVVLNPQNTLITFTLTFVESFPSISSESYQDIIKSIAGYKLDHPCPPSTSN